MQQKQNKMGAMPIPKLLLTMAIQHIFDIGTVSAVQILRDDNQLLSLPNHPANLLQRIFHETRGRMLRPAAEAPLARSIFSIGFNEPVAFRFDHSGILAS